MSKYTDNFSDIDWGKKKSDEEKKSERFSKIKFVLRNKIYARIII